MPEKVWAVRVADREMQIRDLPVGDIAVIAKEHSVSWVLVQGAPLLDLNVAVAVLAKCCAHMGVDAPGNLTGRTIQDHFTQSDDDLPTEYENGIPPEGVDR